MTGFRYIRTCWPKPVWSRGRLPAPKIKSLVRKYERKWDLVMLRWIVAWMWPLPNAKKIKKGLSLQFWNETSTLPPRFSCEISVFTSLFVKCFYFLSILLLPIYWNLYLLLWPRFNSLLPLHVSVEVLKPLHTRPFVPTFVLWSVLALKLSLHFPIEIYLNSSCIIVYCTTAWTSFPDSSKPSVQSLRCGMASPSQTFSRTQLCADTAAALQVCAHDELPFMVMCMRFSSCESHTVPHLPRKVYATSW